ncbi:MAG: hypothetical protein ACE5KM_23945 [Planctomycetaceae bacterium]
MANNMFAVALCRPHASFLLCAAALSPLACEGEGNGDRAPKPPTAAEIQRCKHAARLLAEKDWKRGKAVMFWDDKVAGSFQEKGVTYTYSYDRLTGIAIAPRVGSPFATQLDRIHESSYTARVRELVKKHGIPKWSRKAQLVPPKVLLKYLDLKNVDDKERAKRFPIRFGRSIVLRPKQGKAVEVVIRGADTIIAEDKVTGSLRKVVVDRKRAFGGYKGEAVSVYRSRKYPKVILIRIGGWKVVALNGDADEMGAAYRNSDE